MTELTRRGFLASAAVSAGIGAAAATTLSGRVFGGFSTEVDQGLVIRDVEPYGYEDGLGIVSSDGSAFEVGATIHQGEMWAVHFIIHNRSDERQAQRLRLSEIPDHLSVEVFSDRPTGVEVRRTALHEWIVSVDPAHESSVQDDEQVLEMLVAARNDASPGYKELEGVLVPFDFEAMRR